MHFSPILAWYPWKKCKVGGKFHFCHSKGLSRAELVKNTCFHIKYSLSHLWFSSGFTRLHPQSNFCNLELHAATANCSWRLFDSRIVQRTVCESMPSRVQKLLQWVVALENQHAIRAVCKGTPTKAYYTSQFKPTVYTLTLFC